MWDIIETLYSFVFQCHFLQDTLDSRAQLVILNECTGMPVTYLPSFYMANKDIPWSCQAVILFLIFFLVLSRWPKEEKERQGWW